MVLIRPVIRANQDRTYIVHVFVFFIFLVANIGGALTPLGDPPLFLGFLKGVDFLWTLETMLRPMLLTSGLLLALFYLIDRLAWSREQPEVRMKSSVPGRLRGEGLRNVLYLMAVAATVLVSGIWNRDGLIPIGLGLDVPVNGLARDVVLIAIALLSWRTTPRSIRVENAFTWKPMQEIAMLFAAIFITMVPIQPCFGLVRGGRFTPCLPSRRARCSWVPLPISATRQTSWCSRSARTVALRCQTSSDICCGRARSCCRSSR